MSALNVALQSLQDDLERALQLVAQQLVNLDRANAMVVEAQQQLDSGRVRVHELQDAIALLDSRRGEGEGDSDWAARVGRMAALDGTVRHLTDGAGTPGLDPQQDA